MDTAVRCEGAPQVARRRNRCHKTKERMENIMNGQHQQNTRNARGRLLKFAALALGLALPASLSQAQWLTAGSRIYYSSGPVGIGTTNPAGKLDVRSNTGRTISAFNTATTGYTYAVHGTARSVNGRGVYGIAQNVNGNGSGVFGVSNGNIGRAVYGYSTSNGQGASSGVFGKAVGPNSSGVRGETNNANGFAGYFSGGKSYFQQRVGIGTTNPNVNWGLVIEDVGGGGWSGNFAVGSAAGAKVVAGDVGGVATIGGHNGALNAWRNLAINPSGGNVGIATSSPTHKLDVNGDIRHRTGNQFYFGDTSENTDTFYLERTNSSSNSTQLTLYIGDDPTSNIDYFKIKPTNSSTNTFWFGSDGVAWKNGGGSWSNSSDRRIKRDITDLDGTLDRLLGLRGVNFYYTDLTAPGAAAGLRTGFIAQEVEEVFPEWVTEIHGMGAKHDGLKALTISGFEALTVEAMRDLREEKDAEIAELRAEKDAQIASLEARLARMEQMIAQMAQQDRE
jgi:Chaperone of endosialidase